MQPLDPQAPWYFFFRSLIQLIGPVFLLGLWITLIAKNMAAGTTIVLLGPVLGAIIAYVWAKLTYDNYRYELRDDGFRKEHGVIWKKYVTIPYQRIQNVDIHRGLLARLLGLSDIKIQTAGGISTGSYGATAEGYLPGLSPQKAEEVRDELVRRSQVGAGV